MTQTRNLHADEQQEAERVFEGTIDPSTVLVADDYGAGNRPWCSPPGWGGFNCFQLHVGPVFFNGNMAGKAILIHELTHVWQGVNNVPLWYVINSGCSQIAGMLSDGSAQSAYSIDTSEQKQWNQYNAEQQAGIVGGWYVGGMHTYDWRYRYIAANIRRSDPNATSQPVTGLQLLQGTHVLSPALAMGGAFSNRRIR